MMNYGPGMYGMPNQTGVYPNVGNYSMYQGSAQGGNLYAAAANPYMNGQDIFSSQMNAPQGVTFQQSGEQVEEKKKSGGFWKVLLVAGALVGGASALRKYGLKDYKVLDQMPKDAKKWDVVKNDFAKYYDKTIGKAWEWVKNLFKETPKTQAPQNNAPAGQLGTANPTPTP